MKALKGKDEVVLYLDYDGVLHHEDVWWHPRRGAYIRAPGYELFEHMPLLEAALEPFRNVQIVLSTSWVMVLDSVPMYGTKLKPCQQNLQTSLTMPLAVERP